MEINPHFLAPCGLYCGVCGVYYATRDKNEKFKERLDGIQCEGCLSDNVFGFCKECSIRDCTKTKGYSGCHECDDFPCQYIEEFPMPVGKKVILRAIPYWRENGTEKFVRDEEARYICPGCGHKLFRGAKRCNKCKVAVDLD
jgi:hypothetical protein